MKHVDFPFSQTLESILTNDKELSTYKNFDGLKNEFFEQLFNVVISDDREYLKTDLENNDFYQYLNFLFDIYNRNVNEFDDNLKCQIKKIIAEHLDRLNKQIDFESDINNMELICNEIYSKIIFNLIYHDGCDLFLEKLRLSKNVILSKKII